MAAYYNEHDPFAAAWLRELIREGLIADGEVDERDIQTIIPAELRGFRQCHFFAGIGGWSLALRLAGWPDDRSVWTGSCPCQGYSHAGHKKGATDPRNLWPFWFRLIKECRPHTIFGEQVALAIEHGWLDDVCTKLEGEDYALGTVVLGAHSVGAPHIRQRLWFVADRDDGFHDGGDAADRIVGHADGPRLEGWRRTGTGPDQFPPRASSLALVLADASSRDFRADAGAMDRAESTVSGVPSGISGIGPDDARDDGPSGVWSGEWIYCRDGKYRPIESGLKPLADGIPARVGRLRGYGNAIVPQVAAEMIRAYLEIIECSEIT